MDDLSRIIAAWRENGTPGPWILDRENVGKSFSWCWQLRTEYGGTPVYVECERNRESAEPDALLAAAAPAMADRIEAQAKRIAELEAIAAQAVNAIDAVQKYEQPMDPDCENLLTMQEHEVFEFDVPNARAALKDTPDA